MENGSEYPIVWENELEACKRYWRSVGCDESFIEAESKKCYVIRGEITPEGPRFVMTPNFE